MDEKQIAVNEKYLTNAQTIIDIIEGDLIREGIVVKKGLESHYQDPKDPLLSMDLPSIRIKADQVYDGLGRWSQHPTEEVLIRVQIGGSKARYPKRKDGTYNIDGIVKNVVEAVKYHREHQEAMDAHRAKMAENEEVKARETEGIGFPAGSSHVDRDPANGMYSMKFSGQFENLSVQELAVLARELSKLTMDYNFHPLV